MSEIFLFLNPVHLILIENNKILLLKRSNTGIFDGCWCMPTGKIEYGESPKQAIIREAYEEIGITEAEVELSTVLAAKVPSFFDSQIIHQDMSLFFFCKSYKGKILNMEPHKHSEIGFFDLDDLPDPIIPVVKLGIEQYRREEVYGEIGF
jgi:mutator protein MutT